MKNILNDRILNSGEKVSAYFHLFQEMPMAVYTCDLEGRIELYNKAAIDLWGCEPDVEKDRWYGPGKLYYPDGKLLLPEEFPMATILKGGKANSGEIILLERPDGKRVYVKPHPSPIIDEFGKITGAFNLLQDVTESYGFEAKVAHLAAIVESSEDAVISKTMEGIVTSWNETATRIFGYNAQEMIGQPLTKIIPLARQDEEPQILAKLRRGERVEHFETQRISKDKTLLDISLTISPIKDSSGKIIGASKIARDITSQKQVARLKNENDERLRMAIESTRLGTWEYDPTDNSLVWSNECRLIYNFPADEEIDLATAFNLIHPEDLELVRHQFDSALDPETDGMFDVQYRILRYSDQKTRWVQAKGKVYFDEEKNPCRFIGTMLDNTDDKNREQDLKDSIELFTVMANNVPAMIWMSGIDKFSDYFNNTWLQFTGRKLEQEINEGWLENVHPEDVQGCIDNYIKCYREKRGFHIEYRLRRHDGEYRWVVDNSVPRYDTKGEFAGFISACIDIDDLKKLEQRKDAFIQMASHELKTPITSLKGYVEFLLGIFEGIDEEKLAGSKPSIDISLRSISKQVAKLTRLVTELLDLSRIESGKLEMVKTTFEVGDLVEEIVQDVRFTSPRHSIIFHKEKERVVYADRDRFGQALLNLLTNAIKYSPEANRIDIHLDGDDNTISVRVKDYGIGIEKRDQVKIFERFYRVEGRSEQTYPGFGIGLFIAGEIVSRHDGYITVESEKGKGSVFVVTMPLRSEEGLTDQPVKV